MRHIMLAGFVLIALIPCSAQAQFFFKKAAPRVPAQRVPELIQILRGDVDERKRSAAAEELREYDVKAFPDIVPALVEAAIRDTKHGVRSDALSSLSRIRPVSPMAGQALEYAAANDGHWSNRIQAKSSLMRYHLAGYSSDPSSPKTAPKTAPTSKEPPAAAEMKTPKMNNVPAVVNVPQPMMQTPPIANTNVPAPQFPQASAPVNPYPQASAPVNPYPQQAPVQTNPLVVAPPLRTPPQPAPFPMPIPAPAAQAPQPTPPVAVYVPTNPPPLNPPAATVVNAPPLVVQPYINSLPAAEPSLQFRPASQAAEMPRVAPAAPDEIPLIDLNPVLTPKAPVPALPVNSSSLPMPDGGTSAPPVLNLIAPAQTGNKLPLPPLPNEVPTTSPVLPKF